VPGMYVDVEFHLHETGLLQVPAAALVFRSGGPQVAVVGADGRLHYRAVTIGRDDGATVALAAGVHEGERVVLNVSSRIADGARVVVQGAEQKPAAPAGGKAG